MAFLNIFTKIYQFLNKFAQYTILKKVNFFKVIFVNIFKKIDCLLSQLTEAERS